MDNATVGGSFGQYRYSGFDFRRNSAPNLKKKEVKPWLKQQWCIPEVNAEYVLRMENLLDLYNEPGNILKLQTSARSFDFAKHMKDLVDIYCRQADVIRLYTQISPEESV